MGTSHMLLYSHMVYGLFSHAGLLSLNTTTAKAGQPRARIQELKLDFDVESGEPTAWAPTCYLSACMLTG